jgi:outer membrane protein assembly factor BamB
MRAELLYVGCNGYVAAIDPATGREVWRTSLGGGGAFTSTTRSHDGTVLQHEGSVFAGCHGQLFCLDAATGAERWGNELPGMGYNDVTLAIGDRAIQFVATRAQQ